MKWDLLTAPTQLLLIPLIAVKDAISPPSSMTLNKRLGVSVLWNRLTVAEMALKRGASPHCDLSGGLVMILTPADFNGTPAIFSAASSGNLKMTDLLISAGADINARTSSGTTALHSATQAGKPKRVRFLLERGADPSIPDAKGKLAGDYAAEMKLADVTQLLLQPPAPIASISSSLKSGAADAFNEETVATAQSIAVKSPLQLKKPSNTPTA